MTKREDWAPLHVSPAEIGEINHEWSDEQRGEVLTETLASGEVRVRARLNGNSTVSRVERLLSDRDAGQAWHIGADCVQILGIKGYDAHRIDHMLQEVEFDRTALRQYVIANLLPSGAKPPTAAEGSAASFAIETKPQAAHACPTEPPKPRGPKPGTGRHKAVDCALFSEIERLRAARPLSVHAAALALARGEIAGKRVEGGGSAESRAKRLAAAYRQSRGDKTH